MKYDKLQLISHQNAKDEIDKIDFFLFENSKNLTLENIQANTTGLSKNNTKSTTTIISESFTIKPKELKEFIDEYSSYNIEISSNKPLTIKIDDMHGKDFSELIRESLIKGKNKNSISIVIDDLKSIRNLGNNSIDITISKEETIQTQNNSLFELKNLKEGELTNTNAIEYINSIKHALDKLQIFQSSVGSMQNQIDQAINFQDRYATNLSIANSYITDTDYSTSMIDLLNDKMKQHSGLFAYSQANILQENVLKLLT